MYLFASKAHWQPAFKNSSGSFSVLNYKSEFLFSNRNRTYKWKWAIIYWILPIPGSLLWCLARHLSCTLFKSLEKIFSLPVIICVVLLPHLSASLEVTVNVNILGFITYIFKIRNATEFSSWDWSQETTEVQLILRWAATI